MRWWISCVAMVATLASAQQPIPVPSSPPANAKEQSFRDARFGVRFRIPPGWSFNRKDGEVSTFHLDARSAPARAQMRGVASIEFNPFPLSTLSGAMLYYSVERHAHEGECARQANASGQPSRSSHPKDTVDIGGMTFTHGHDEHGGICIEARDNIYTAYRKRACYRFDLELNTFCSVSSGAQELTEDQMKDTSKREWLGFSPP